MAESKFPASAKATRQIRSGLYGGDAGGIINASQRIGQISDALPCGASPFTTMQLNLPAAVREAAKTLPTPDLALRTVTA